MNGDPESVIPDAGTTHPWVQLCQAVSAKVPGSTVHPLDTNR